MIAAVIPPQNFVINGGMNGYATLLINVPFGGGFGGPPIFGFGNGFIMSQINPIPGALIAGAFTPTVTAQLFINATFGGGFGLGIPNLGFGGAISVSVIVNPLSIKFGGGLTASVHH